MHAVMLKCVCGEEYLAGNPRPGAYVKTCYVDRCEACHEPEEDQRD